MAKTIVCVARSSDFRAETRLVVTQPQTQAQTQTRHLHVPTQAAARRAVSISVSFSSLYLLRRHHQHHSTKMDAALAKIFVSNAQWVKAVSAAEPGFFEQSAKGQSPKVRAIYDDFSSSATWRCGRRYFCVGLFNAYFRVHTNRSSGSDARTLASQKVS